MAHFRLRLVAGRHYLRHRWSVRWRDEARSGIRRRTLTNAMQDIAAEYKREKCDVVSSFALLLQRAGAPDRSGRAGGFVHLADQKWMDYAADKSGDTTTRETLLQ